LRDAQRGIVVVLCIALLLVVFATLAHDTEAAGAGRQLTAVANASFSPATLQLAVGQVVIVDVMVHSVQDLSGYEFRLSFDPAVVEAVDLDPYVPGLNVLAGDVLAPAMTATNECDNLLGTISVAVARIGGAPSNGDGRLATISFRAKALGDAQMVFTAFGMADSNALPIPCDLTDPVYLVADGATATATAELSATPTSTATAGPSATPSRTATPTVTGQATATPTQTPSVSPTPYYYVSPQTLSVRPGQQVSVEIRTSHVPELGGVQIEMDWDPTLLRAIDALPAELGVQLLPGNLFEGLNPISPPNGNWIDNATGHLSYSSSLTNSPSHVAGAWTVGTITFEALAQGVTALHFDPEATWMSHPAWGNVWCGWQDGVVTVVEPTATPTITQTPTQTPTVTLTPTWDPSVPTYTPTATATATLEPTIPAATMTPTPTATSQFTGLFLPLVFRDRMVQ
jgi:hypothetical protein